MTSDPLARLKVLLDSSTPIAAIETVEEVRAVRPGARGLPRP
jgi:hypothetical protein